MEDRAIPIVEFMPISLEENVIRVCRLYQKSFEKTVINRNTSLFNKYPKLAELIDGTEELEKIYEYIKLVVTEDYIRSYPQIENAVNRFQRLWDPYNDQFMKSLSKKLNFKWDDKHLVIKALVGSFNRYPRDLDEMSFCVGYEDLITDDYLIEHVAHECTHFLYFNKCKAEIPELMCGVGDSPAWLLSEMVVDPILNSEEIRPIFSDRPNIKNKSYQIFYTAENIETMNVIKSFYKDLAIEDAMVQSYNYLLDHPIVK